MQTTILILLGCSIVLAAVAYYVGFVRPPKSLAWLAQGSCMTATLVLVPFFVTVLWLQHGATRRLAELGIMPHPAIQEAVGIAAGIGEAPTWMFTVTDTAEAALDFYDDPTTRPDWTVVRDEPKTLILKRGEQFLAITSHGNGAARVVIYQLTQK